MATNKSLYDPVPTYRKFVDNQVLTDDQLNAALDHFNYQDQLSRVLLSGVGITCGLHLSLTNSGETGVELNGGSAVTTDGNLMKVGDTIYKGFKLYRDDTVKYSTFLEDDEETTMPLWELEIDTDPSDVHPLKNFESETGFSLEEAIAVLYLEDYLKEQEDCSPVDCDTQGREAVNTIRVLLVSPENAQKIARKDSILSDLMPEDGEPLGSKLPPIYTPRVVLNETNTGSYSEFRKAYTVQFSNLANRIMQLGSLDLFKEIFEAQEVNPDNVLGSLSGSVFNTQYLYDLYKDLVTAYSELREKLKKYYAICSPDPDAFPKHVLMGSLSDSESPWRHKFYPSPILNHPNSLDNLKSAFRRLLLMVKDFKTGHKERIRITPSRNGQSQLGERAIPFYYDIEDSEDPGAFFDNWKEGDIEIVPNYYGYNYPGSDFDPLDICLDGHDFYRIEGHVGQHVMDVHEELQDIKEGKGLAFDIKPVAIGEYPDEETIDYDEYRVYFEDLQVVLQAWNEEQECMMESASEFLSGFSLTEPGRHINYTIEDSSNSSDVNYVLADTPMITAYRVEEEQPSYTAYRTKAKENYVIKGITEEQGTLGGTMLENNTIVSSYNRGEVIYNTNKAVEGLVEDWELDIKEAAVNIPVELLGHLKETEDHKLTDIEDFTEENLKKYIDALKAQCKQTQASKKRFQRLSGLKEYTAAQPWIEQYEFILNRIISSCCLIKKVEVLYEKILERKHEVLKQRVLENFIDRYPGAEHKAGVPDGGTFVLLYLSRKQKPESGSVRAESVTARRHILAVDTRSNLKKYQLPHGTVIGDLCLPYICCSETPSTTYVFPEQLATLRLPVDHLCVGEDEAVDPIRMDVTPADAEVKVFIQERELSGVAIRNETGLFFDANRVSSDDYDKVIRFEVNGQPVEPILQLYRKPDAEFSFSENIEYRNENTVAIVTFTNTSKPFDDLSFEWDFNGEIVENKNAVEFKHSFDVQPGENYDFEVKLTAAFGLCKDIAVESVNIEVPDIEEPVEECEEVTARMIKSSVNNMERLFQTNPDLLSEVQPSYKDEMQPVYENILSNIEEALVGNMDGEVFAFIQKAHFVIEEMIGTYNTNTEREFALTVYYELILLYFYLQACRDEAVEVHAEFSDVAGGWADFTNRAKDEFPQAYKALMESNDIHEKLMIIRKRMNQRFDEQVTDIVDKLISNLSDDSV